ncbi:C-C motif chemokine 3-like [Tachysurus fulvidraco]|uniref:C-C motif chemokine 3-like n=1 Tax=Tachysurus fulvidraco TaxID=1234273 RepID=UPI000F4D9E1D|nr:C-C motif chemokine 3-like [Tachysurus fulvidraco]
MISRALLLVLLVLACLQSFTMAQNANGPKKCCFTYQTNRVPVKYIERYEITEALCSKPGIIFIMKDSRLVCADPHVDWVKSNMNKLDQQSPVFKSFVH